LPSPQLMPSGQVSATPEPAEWLLISIALLMLGMVYQRNHAKTIV
jgi:hypothetical protein